MSEEEKDGLAAEYVLGTLDASERSLVDARRKTDASLSAAIEAWQRRLAPLSDRMPGVAPPSHLLDGILSRISTLGAPHQRSAEVNRSPHKSGRRWGLAVGATALAASLALVAGLFIHLESDVRPTDVAGMDCSRQYMDFWRGFDRMKYARLSAEQLAGTSRMALRAFDACQAGDEQDAKSLFLRLQSTN
jgi:anti-sigma-K factor RskA